MIDIQAAFLIAAGIGVKYRSHHYQAGRLTVVYSVGEREYQSTAAAKNASALPMHRAVKVCAADARDKAYSLNGGLAADLADAKEKAGLE